MTQKQKLSDAKKDEQKLENFEARYVKITEQIQKLYDDMKTADFSDMTNFTGFNYGQMIDTLKISKDVMNLVDHELKDDIYE